MTRIQINEIEKQLKDKRRAYNKCRNFARRVKLNYEIETLYERLAGLYKNLEEN